MSNKNTKSRSFIDIFIKIFYYDYPSSSRSVNGLEHLDGHRIDSFNTNGHHEDFNERTPSCSLASPRTSSLAFSFV